MFDPYRQLGIDREASPQQVKAAYRRACRIHHPDKNPGDEFATARFQLIKEAYEILIDPEQRARFDRGEAPKPPDLHEGARAVMVQAFLDCLKKRGPNGIVANTAKSLRAEVSELRVQQSQIAGALSMLNDTTERFQYGGTGENLLADVVADQVMKVTAEMNAFSHKIALRHRAIELLGDYRDLAEFALDTGTVSGTRTYVNIEP